MPPNLTLSTEAETEIDPITYEVVRHGLWNANAEHVREIENLAVSQITVEIRDFQPCILTEDAELLYFGPCLQYMSRDARHDDPLHPRKPRRTGRSTATCGSATTRSSAPPTSPTSA